MDTDADRAWMARAIELAERGLRTTTPNPRVGCVLVRDGALVGEGWHVRPGGSHAEVAALDDARARGRDPAGATAYVSLEPCNHTGRTPPCADALIRARVARVVCAMRDPHALAAGGVERLRAAGIAVDVGVMAHEARELNVGFVSRVTRGRPWVRTKLAASLDGRTALANGTSRWITGPEARADGHGWRARACAILTGIGTVRDDDPQLTVRAIDVERQPLRVVVDRHAQTPPAARVLAGGALVVTGGIVRREPRFRYVSCKDRGRRFDGPGDVPGPREKNTCSAEKVAPHRSRSPARRRRRLRAPAARPCSSWTTRC